MALAAPLILVQTEINPAQELTMSRDDLSPKEMDRLVEMAEARNKWAIANAENNSPAHVGQRYDELKVQYQCELIYNSEYLFPAGRKSPKKCEWWGAEDGNGIVAVLRSHTTCRLALYRVVSDGCNGVKVSEKLDDLDL